ncbi:MAG: hypothetical protein MUP70_14070 [Candidatus Aminicenantes bacterium]|nr:hypothetical protein [Candidatus Aminicenantes bacterium]
MKGTKLFRRIPVFILVFILAVPGLMAQGHFEIGFHYSGWSLNIIRSLINDAFDSMAEEFVNSTEEEIQKNNPDFYVEDWSSDSDFNSDGSNWGVEMRWYPGGHDGSFSLGLSIEKTTINLNLDPAAVDVFLRNDVDQQSGTAQINASGGLMMKPMAFMLSFRGNIHPAGRISPYFQTGFGFASIQSLKDAELSFNYNYTFKVPGEADETGGDSENKTLGEIEDERVADGEESWFDKIPFFPFFTMVIGVRARIIQNVHLIAEGGIFNGFIIRGGLSIRF